MEAIFKAISIVEKWLRQKYSKIDSSSNSSPRVFWNHIMVVMGAIMLKQQGLVINQSNLERYTPIPASSIYRTLRLLTAYGVFKETEDIEFGNLIRP